MTEPRTDGTPNGSIPSPTTALASTSAAASRRTIIGPPISGLQRAVLPATPDHHGARPPMSSPPRTIFDARRTHDTPEVFETVEPAEPAIMEWPVQREPQDGGTAATPDEAPVLRAEATSGPAAALATAPSEGRSDAEVDELLRTLYPSLRRRLCRDLLLDRERAGYGTDIRF